MAGFSTYLMLRFCHSLRVTIVLLCAFCPACAQRTAGHNPQGATAKFEFDTASVKLVHDRPAGGIVAGLRIGAGRVSMEFVTLNLVIETAYNVPRYRIVGPAWLDSDHFDIVATLPEGATREQVHGMLQTLLAERFQFACHSESRVVPIYALVVAKSGSKLRPAPSEGNRMSTSNGTQGHHVRGQLILANLINTVAVSSDRPILDMTGLEGYFDLDLRWSDESGTAESPSLFTALQETLGLKLEPRKAPLDVIVVDRVKRIPTEN
jgi:uncharacterized protein (TIGR03435 family)